MHKMSLLPTVTAGSTSVSYFIENVGAPGGVNFDTPCIKGSITGAIRVGDPDAGLVLRGDVGGVNSFIRGGAAAASTLALGSSSASFQNIALTDNLTTINTPLIMTNPANDLIVAGDIGVGGDVIFATAGKSISGYFNAQNAPQNVIDGAPDAAVPNPAGLTTGWYIVSCACAPGGQPQEQISTIARYVVGSGWVVGGCNSNLAGAGRFGFNVAVDRSTLALANNSGANQLVTVFFAKLLN
jgi:hypothetical protein